MGSTSTNSSALLSRRMEGLKTYRPGRLARNTMVLTMGWGLRTVLQATLFLGVARSLGAEGYGQFVATLAITALFAPFVGLGSAAWLQRQTARNPEAFPAEFGRAFLLILLSGPILFALALLGGNGLLGSRVTWEMLVVIALAELICNPLVELCACAFKVFERMWPVILLTGGMVFARLLAFGILLANQGMSPGLWAIGYFMSTAVFTVAALLYTYSNLGRPYLRVQGVVQTALEGIYFALGGASERIQSDIDKALLVRLDSAYTAGVYSAAYRLVDMAMLPIHSLLAAATARFFRAGEGGTQASARYALRLLPGPLAYALIMGTVLLSTAGLLPWMLGSSFADSESVVHWLAWLPAVMLIRVWLTTIAGVSGHHRLSAVAVASGAACNAALNLLWIPRYGWKGAALATFAAEGWVILLLLCRAALSTKAVRQQN